VGIGRFGVLTVEQARELAKTKLALVALGQDPAQERKEGRKAKTVSEVCDWFLEEAKAGRILGRKRRPIKTSTLRMDECRIETHIKPLLGSRQVQALRLVDIEGMQSDIAAGKTAKPRPDGRGGTTTGGPGVAGRTTSTLRNIFAHALRLSVIESNPAVGVRVLASKKKERRLKNHEITLLGRAMREAEKNGEHAIALAVVRFLLLSGYRISEAQGLKREWLNIENYYVLFPDTKTDGQARVVSQLAGKLGESQPVQNRCPYVFPSDVGDGHFKSAEGCLARLCRAAGLENVTPHTLRHTFGSVAGDLGYSELTIAALLGHAARTVTQGYVHIDGPLRAAADRIANEIAQLLDKEGAPALRAVA
jgi:integrase